jgi:hypothetical protein
MTSTYADRLGAQVQGADVPAVMLRDQARLVGDEERWS